MLKNNYTKEQLEEIELLCRGAYQEGWDKCSDDISEHEYSNKGYVHSLTEDEWIKRNLFTN